MRIAPLVAAGTLILGLACATAELTDGRRMPVVKIEALVTATCSRPWDDWPPPPDSDDTYAADTGPAGCDPVPQGWAICVGRPITVYTADDEREKLLVRADRETVDGWDGLVWLSRSGYGRLPDDVDGELGVGIDDVGWVSGAYTGLLYTVDWEGRTSVLRDDLLVAEVGDQLVFAYPVGGFDVVETHQIGWVDERRVDPAGREGPSCCCVSGPTRGATGGFALAFLLATLRRQSTRAKPTT
jgi:hypothetical protein